MSLPNDPENLDCVADFNALRRQLAALRRFQTTPARWESLLERQVSDTTTLPVINQADGGACPALQPSKEERAPVPYAAGEILVAAPNVLRGEVDTILTQFGFDPTSPIGLFDCGDGELPPVLYYRAADRDVDVQGAVTAIRDAGAMANANVLRVMNVVTKSKGGAEPACCFPPTEASQADNKNHESGLVVVLDTGIWADDHGNDWLASIADSDPDPRFDDSGKLNLSAGHGTFVAGVLRFVSRDLRVVVKRVISGTGFASDTTIAEGIEWAAGYIAAHGGHGVINLSLGGEADGAPPIAIEQELRKLIRQRIAVVCAAGNRSSGEAIYPAAFSRGHGLNHVVAVASLTRNETPSSWSNRADWVDFSAIGEGITSAFVAGEERQGSSAPDDPYDPEPDLWVPDRPWAVWTGTSFATPQIAARLAEFLPQHAMAEDAVQQLRDDLDPAGDAEIPNFGIPLNRPPNLPVVR